MNNSELYPIFPIFIVADVSASMAGGPIEALNEALPDLQKEMISNPTVGEIARIGMVTFSDIGRTVLPFGDLAMADLPELMVEGATNFAAGFREARAAIAAGVGSLPKGTPLYRPVVFFMSDGMHVAGEDWAGALDELRDRTWKFAPEIVTFGFGDANDDALRRIATRYAFRVKDAPAAVQVREIINALISSIRTTSSSFRDPGQSDGLHIEASPEFFTALPALTV